MRMVQGTRAGGKRGSDLETREGERFCVSLGVARKVGQRGERSGMALATRITRGGLQGEGSL